MSQTQAYVSDTLDATVAKAISELNEIKSRSEQTDARLSSAFYRGTLLFLRHGKQALLSAVIDTCTRLRVRDVENTLVWSTQGGLVFRKMEGLSLPIVTDKQTAIYALVGHKKAGVSLFTLIQQYQTTKRAQAKAAKAAASAALAQADLIFALQATQKAVETTARKFPKHSAFFQYLQNCINDYTTKA